MRESQLAGGSGGNNVRADDWGWIDVTAIRLLPGDAPPVDLTSGRRYISPDDGNPDDQTVLSVPAAGGDPARRDGQRRTGLWNREFPRTFARTGVLGNYFFIAQWFPKLGVLEDAGWNCHQFHRGTEFFADYGVYDVRLTVPRGWVLGASGREQARRDNADDTTTYTYRAEDVHDFAWTTSPDYIERKARFEHPTLPPSTCACCCSPSTPTRPTVTSTPRARRSVLRRVVRRLSVRPHHDHRSGVAERRRRHGVPDACSRPGSRWLVPRGVTQPEGVTIHEAGHQFWYGHGRQQRVRGRVDGRGVQYLLDRPRHRRATRSTGSTTRRAGYFGGFVPCVFRDIPRSRDGRRATACRATGVAAKSDVAVDAELAVLPVHRRRPLLQQDRAVAAHARALPRLADLPAVMSTLLRVAGSSATRGPQDFFAVVNEVSGRDMTWFFDQVYRSSNVFDYGVDAVRSEPVEGRGMTRSQRQDRARLRRQHARPDALDGHRPATTARRCSRWTCW